MEYPGEKLLIKMWESLADKGVGSLLEPWKEKRLAEVRLEIRRNEMLKIAQAEKEVEAIKSGNSKLVLTPSQYLLSAPESTFDDKGRIEPTLNLAELASSVASNDFSDAIRKETNIAKAILNAEDILKDDQQEPSEELIEDDWLYSWRDYAGKVSSSELQDLWGRILAGEVKQPGSYSMRTLEFLKGLSKSEAILISKVARFVVIGRVFRNKDKFLEAEGVNFNRLMFLQDIGVMSGVEAAGLSTTIGSATENRFYRAIVANNKVLLIQHEDKNKKLKIPVYLLTQVGAEVLKLASFDVNQEYLTSIAEDFVKQGYKVQVADWVQQTPESGQFFNPKEIKLAENA